MLKKFISFFVAFCLFASSVISPAQAQIVSSAFNLPIPGSQIPLSKVFCPAIVRGITVYSDNPLKFDFIIDTGDNNLQNEDFKLESEKLIRYFLTALTVPEDEFWVNLSPYEKDRIIPEGLGMTEMGRDLLVQDYLLKQITASLMYPENELGNVFWDRVYAKVYEKFGTTDVPVDTFNKVWIIPDKAIVYESGNSAYVGERHLKVMLEEDYQAFMAGQPQENIEDGRVQNLTAEIVQEILIPELEKEVNTGKNFAVLRQVFNSMILATWYKKNLKESFLGKIYLDQNKVKGIDIEDKKIKSRIYDQYVAAFRKGVFSFIKETYDLQTQSLIPRKYFSGGVAAGVVKVNDLETRDLAMLSKAEQEKIVSKESLTGDTKKVSINLVENMSGIDEAMLSQDLQFIVGVSSVLSQQDANVVFEKNQKTGQWLFRRGPIDLEVNENISKQLGVVLEKQNKTSMILSLRNDNSDLLETAFQDVLLQGKDVLTAFNDVGIPITYDFKRVLLVAPFGDMNGDPLKYKVPHKGVELIAHELIRSSADIDALVYNPNLGSREGLYEFVKNNHFDVIGISVLQAVLKANLEILGQLSLLSPDSVFVAGGGELSRFPLDVVAKSWPVDVLSFNSGTSLLNVVNNYSKDLSKMENLKSFKSVSNIAVNEAGTFIKTKREKDEPLIFSEDIDSEISYSKPDLIHGDHYDAVEPNNTEPIAFDRIGRKPTRIPLGDYCKGKCIFCGTIRGRRKDLAPEKVIELIVKADPSDDSIHFESADFLYDPESAQRLSSELARIMNIKKIPKLAIARVDEVGDGAVVNAMARSGFKIIAFGIESFTDEVLKGIGKETTGEDNIKALDIAVDAGIKPGLNLILFTPWDTVDTTLNTIDLSLHYMEKGAYINVVPYLFAGFGRPISRMTDILDYEKYDFPGLKEPFLFPRLSRIFNKQLAGLRDKVYSKLTDIEYESDYPEWAKRSVSVYSLLIYKAFIETLREEGVKGSEELDKFGERIEEAIQRVIRAEASTLKEPTQPSATGVSETWFNPFNQLLTTVILNTEDGKKIKLRITDDYPDIPSDGTLPSQMIYNLYSVETVEGNEIETYKGWVRFHSSDNNNVASYEVVFRRKAENDVFVHRVLADFADSIEEDGTLLIDQLADYRKTGLGLVPHYHRLPSEPLFGERASRAATDSVSYKDFMNEVKATYNQGLISLAEALFELRSLTDSEKKSEKSRFALPINPLDKKNINVKSLLSPYLAISDMDLTQFPSDADAERVMQELAENALKYKSAAISVYPQHLKYLPIQKLKEAGVHIGVVVAFPVGLSPQMDIEKELAVLEEAVQHGADEVDFVIDFQSIIKGEIGEAEKSLAKFALGVEEIKHKHNLPLRTKAILETSALKTEQNIRTATDMALKYVDLIKMVSGFPVESDGGERGRGSLFAARIILNEILSYYKRTGILRAMKITGGIGVWDDKDAPDRSAKNYYELVLNVFGKHLGYHYIFERDLFRMGGYGGLKAFMEASSQQPFIVDSKTEKFDSNNYPDIQIAVSSDDTSLNMDSYLSSKFPTEMREAFLEGGHSIELHRGSVSTSESYVQYLAYQGYKVEQLLDVKSAPPYHKFYKVTMDGETSYIISGVLGEARELFLLQSISGFYHVPDNLISIRTFDEGSFFDLYNQTFEKYAGRLNQAVLLHEIDNYLATITKDGAINLKVVERVKTDLIDAIVVQTGTGDLVLLFEMQFANGSHAGKVVDYLTSPISEGGLGVKDITLHGASGGIGENIKVNDLVVYDDLYWKDEKLDNIPQNDVNKEKLTTLLPESVQLHETPIFDIPTVLNGSISVMDYIESKGGGIVELEVTHAALAAAKHNGVKFRAFYEVHDKPATTSTLDKKEAIGDEIAGYRDPEKRQATWVALAEYLFEGKEVQNDRGETSEKVIQESIENDVQESAVHGVDIIKSQVIDEKIHNVMFLGNGNGLAYFGYLQEQWNAKDGKLLYWDAKEHMVLMDQGISFLDLLPEGIGSDVFFDMQSGSYTGKVLFIDNVEEIFKRPFQRQDMQLLLNQQKDVPVVGYLSAANYADIENIYSEANENFDNLNFELTQEVNPVLKSKKVVVLGATGLVGRQVMSLLKQRGYLNVEGFSLHGDESAGIQSADLTNEEALDKIISSADVVINSAVDLNFPGMQAGGLEAEQAYAVNVGIPKAIQRSDFQGKLIQLSSFYVFGHNEGKVFTNSQTEPISVYGQHKLEAEEIVKTMDDSAIVRLGPLFGFDARGQQKGFYQNVIGQLENKRQGNPTEPVKATTYPVSPIISVEDVSSGIISLLEKDFTGVSQLSGKNALSSAEQAALIQDVYNKKFGTNIQLDIDVEVRSKEGSLTPDAKMYSFISPDVYKAVSDLINATLADRSDSAMLGNNFKKGGIDFNSELLKLEIKRDDNGAPVIFDQGPVEGLKIDGFVPVIINISPVSAPMIMGDGSTGNNSPYNISSLK